jgi:hypothetical protein
VAPVGRYLRILPYPLPVQVFADRTVRLAPCDSYVSLLDAVLQNTSGKLSVLFSCLSGLLKDKKDKKDMKGSKEQKSSDKKLQKL